MLTGVLFAIEEAADQPGRLLATMNVAGTSVVEHQARQLVAAGAGQIVVIGDGASDELRQALTRLRRRGIAIELAGDARALAAALHPLARSIMMADGLVTTDAVVRSFARNEGEALLVMPAATAPRRFERIGDGLAWAGLARVEARRTADLAQLPPDYAPQSTLLRLVAAGGAARLPLGTTALGDGHDIAADAATLAESGRRLVTAALRPRHDWFDRWISTPTTRLTLPPLIARRVDTAVIAATAGSSGVVAVAAVALDRFGLGLSLAVAATLGGAVAAAMAELRDEAGLRRWVKVGVLTMTAAVALILGWRCDAVRGDGSALPVAIALVTATVLVERTGAAPARWWGGAASCTLLVAAATWLGWPVVGLGLAAVYVALTLAVAIETLRRGLARP